MPKDYSRADRVASQIRRELAEFIRLQVNDPRVRMVTLTDVEVARDYSHAKVFYTTLSESKVAESKVSEANRQVQQGLERASGFLRSQLAHSMKLRITPQLHFVYDPTIASGARLSQLIDQAVAGDHRDSGE
ncbi:MAG: 30S ribosome-binding factor RbfA [Candidatus Nitrotoga sp.]